MIQYRHDRARQASPGTRIFQQHTRLSDLVVRTCADHGVAPTRFGRDALNDPALVANLRAGRRPRPDADDDDDDDAGEAKGRKAERQRWASVLSHKASGEGRIATACNLLATTNMSAAAIVSTLSTIAPAQQAKAPGLHERMAGSRNASLGLDGGKPGGGTLASRIIAAGKKRRGEA